MRTHISFIAVAALLFPLAVIGAPAPKPAEKLSYEKDVKPLLVAKCYACHGNGTKLGGFSLESRDAVLTGGATTHPVVSPGDGAKSYLVKLVSGEIPGKIMPARGARLTPREVGVLKRWVDEGVSFGASAAQAWTAPLEPRHPKLPASKPGANPVDLLTHSYFLSNKIVPKPMVDDRTYARRVYLDLVGMLPTPEELHAFLSDKRADKRTRLARALLNDKQRYAEHWLTFWNDLLRNDYAGTGYIDGGRTQITSWLYTSLLENKPYDRFVTELVNPTPESAGFVKGIVWRGVVNASQTPQMQAAQNISQVFMGVNLKCASCHNSFISTWKLADAYGMAGIYADAPLEMVRCDKPTGDIAPIKFLYPQLGSIDSAAPKTKRMEQLAGILTSKQNGRLSRTLVNRLWGKLMGRGLVEPEDEMDNRPWDPALLDWLASDLMDHGYDVKRTLELIVTSQAYQLPAAGLPSERVTDFKFTGPVVKRMSAEQFTDAVSSLTGVWSQPASQFQISKGKPVLPWGNRAQVRFSSGVLRKGSVDIDVDVTGSQVLFLVGTDAGDKATNDWIDWCNPRIVTPKGEVRLTDLKWRTASTGYGAIHIGQSVVEKPLRLGETTYPNGIGTHANSIITYILPEGATRFRATAGPDQGAVEVPNSPVSIELYVITGERSLIETRAALALSDPLTRALGRPNREQLVTQRSTAATTLQALELTNGRTLAQMLGQGAESWVKEGRSADEVVNRVYEHALGRLPTPMEKKTALELLGTPVKKEGIEDLLWAVVMLPDFQLVY